MKKLTIIFLLIITASCSVNGIRKKVPVQQKMLVGVSLEKEMKTYSLEIPETWYSYKEVHGHIMHSPKVMQKRSDNHFENNFYVKEILQKETNAKSVEAFFEYYHKKMKGFYPTINFIPQKLIHKKYGEYYLIKFGSFWAEKREFTNIDVLFHYKNRNFELSYISENKYYDEFISDVERIVKSFKIKE